MLRLEGGIRKSTILKWQLAGCLPYQKNGAIVRQVVGYDRFVGEHASSATHRTVPGAALVCELFSTLYEIALQTARREKSALRVRPCEDPARAASCSQEYCLLRSSRNCSRSPRRLTRSASCTK